MNSRLGTEQKTIILTSPLSGRVVPLEAVPDKVFAEKMMGEGVAIIPDGTLLISQVNGSIETIAETAHAVGITTEDGIDLLIHLGLDTVQLKGSAFSAQVHEGESISKGDLLIRFDPVAIKAAGYNSITPITVVNSDSFAAVTPAGPVEVQIGDPLIVITMSD